MVRYRSGDYVLYHPANRPPWPAVICNIKMVPPEFRKPQLDSREVPIFLFQKLQVRWVYTNDVYGIGEHVCPEELGRKHPGLREAYACLVNAIADGLDLQYWKIVIAAEYGLPDIPNPSEPEKERNCPSNKKETAKSKGKRPAPRGDDEGTVNAEHGRKRARTDTEASIPHSSPGPSNGCSDDRGPETQGSGCGENENPDNSLHNSVATQASPEPSGVSPAAGPGNRALDEMGLARFDFGCEPDESPDNDIHDDFLNGSSYASQDYSFLESYYESNGVPESHITDDDETEIYEKDEEEEEEEEEAIDPSFAIWLIGPNSEQFHIPISAVRTRPHLMQMRILLPQGKTGWKVWKPSFAKIDPVKFQPVAEYLSTGDFHTPTHNPSGEPLDEDGIVSAAIEAYAGAWEVAEFLSLHDLMGEIVTRMSSTKQDWPLLEILFLARTVYSVPSIPAYPIEADSAMRALLSSFIAERREKYEEEYGSVFLKALEQCPELDADLQQVSRGRDEDEDKEAEETS